jgi:hypothetical protein
VLSSAQRDSNSATTALRAAATGYHPSERLIDPIPPPEPHPGAPCWVSSPGAAPHYGPPETDSFIYLDKDGNWVEQSSTGEIISKWGPGNTRPEEPEICWLAGPHADRSVCGPATTMWTYPDEHGNLVTEKIGPSGTRQIPFRTPYGPLIP